MNMSKRKLPGGLAVAEAAKITCTDSDSDATAPKYPTVQGPVDFSPMNGVQIDFTIAASAVAVSNEAVQVIESQHAPEHPALQLDKVQGSPPKMVPKGSPAESFMQASPTKVTEDVSALTCNLSLIPKDRWNKRRSLSAIVLAALPIQSKSSTVRRNVVLRDELDECTVTVWGNHTNILNEAAIGRPVTLQRVCLTAFEGKIQIAMPKDSSVALGNTPQTIPILHWMQRVGTTAVTVTQVRQRQYSNECENVLTTLQAIAMQQSTVVCIHGILAKVVHEIVQMKDSTQRPLITISIADGPPKAFLTIQFWNASSGTAELFEQLMHQAVNVTKIRVVADPERGNRYESIGALSKVFNCKNPPLETWWFRPEEEA
jgi:hypothetical protein